MNANEIMTKEVYVCNPGDSLNEAARIMWDHDCGCVPIVDQMRRVVGIITDRDICMAAYTKGVPLGSICIESVMSEDVQSCQAEDSSESIEEIMMEHQVRRVVVVDDQNYLLGIISLSDLALAVVRTHEGPAQKPLDRMLIAETLASVCEHREPTQERAEMASPLTVDFRSNGQKPALV